MALLHCPVSLAPYACAPPAFECASLVRVESSFLPAPRLTPILWWEDPLSPPSFPLGGETSLASTCVSKRLLKIVLAAQKRVLWLPADVEKCVPARVRDIYRVS